MPIPWEGGKADDMSLTISSQQQSITKEMLTSLEASSTSALQALT